LTIHNLLHPSQSGFRPQHSCHTALTKIIDEWLSALDNGQVIGTVFLDLQKAFDIVDHNILLKKLRIYKCDDSAVEWFSSYLSTRTQKVCIGNSSSSARTVESGVPQGSILGPLLFLLFINDMPLSLAHSQPDLFADDTTVHKADTNICEIQRCLNADMINICNWCRNNGMVINGNKSSCMLCGTKRKLSKMDSEFSINVNDMVIQNTPHDKLLGIYIDQHLTWERQIDHVCSIITSRITLLQRIKKYLTMSSRKAFYNGYILPIIDYCCTVWGSCSKVNLDRILCLQKRAARIIMDAAYDAPSKELFKQLAMMTIYQRIEYHKATLIYKSLNGLAPSYLSEKFLPTSQSHTKTLRSSTNGHLVIPKPNTEFFKKSFQYSGSVLWNSLPKYVTNVSSVHSFQANLRKHLCNV
jgi:ribonuclease P/MRP protein subunit RPP40